MTSGIKRARLSPTKKEEGEEEKKEDPLWKDDKLHEMNNAALSDWVHVWVMVEEIRDWKEKERDHVIPLERKIPDWNEKDPIVFWYVDKRARDGAAVVAKALLSRWEPRERRAHVRDFHVLYLSFSEMRMAEREVYHGKRIDLIDTRTLFRHLQDQADVLEARHVFEEFVRGISGEKSRSAAFKIRLLTLVQEMTPTPAPLTCIGVRLGMMSTGDQKQLDESISSARSTWQRLSRQHYRASSRSSSSSSSSSPRHNHRSFSSSSSFHRHSHSVVKREQVERQVEAVGTGVSKSCRPVNDSKNEKDSLKNSKEPVTTERLPVPSPPPPLPDSIPVTTPTSSSSDPARAQVSLVPRASRPASKPGRLCKH